MAASTEDYVEALRVSLKETERLRVQNRKLVATAREPIAIVSMACRLPGEVDSPQALWRLVESEGDAITPFPLDRGWNVDALGLDLAVAGGTAQGGFVQGAEQFDPAFFGISPREALLMDPQQRLLLELCWEAFERAGILPEALQGSRTGIFVGAAPSGYGVGAAPTDGAQGYALTGGATSILSGRVAYVFGLEGPAVTVDTACSSSLVALHLAVQALRAGECDLALAGGITVLATPDVFGAFSVEQGLASDGRCKSYAAAADGTGWSEGAGVLLVERLSDAQRLGHEVLAVVRGSAINQDGASNGLTAPNGPSQQRVIRQALASARLSAVDVDVVEGHGTGTRLGDPIEAQALLATYGQGREAGSPLWLGSVKSNIGHTQSAAGVAGVIKMIMAMRHGTMPATLHVDEPSPQVDWSAGAVRLLSRSRPWPSAGRARRAGVSSFGISGTNAHVIIEQAPESVPADERTPPAPAAVTPPAVVPWVVSGRSAAGLRAQAERLRDLITSAPALAVADVAWSLATARASLEHRAVVVGADVASISAGLDAVVSGDATAGVVGEGRLAFLFTGQGSQRAGMGLGLYEAFPVFAEAFDAVCAELDGRLKRPLREVLADGVGLEQTAWTQAALFAVEVAVFRLVESWGVTPDYVLGHSVGEIAAAHAAGVLSLADACLLVSERGRLMQALPAGGAMAAVGASEEDVRADITEYPVEIAAVNAPASVVVSGDAASIDAYVEVCRGLGRRVSRLNVSHAFHSGLMEPMLAGFEAVLAGLTFHEPRIPIVSNLTGALAQPGAMSSPDYWVRQVREAVRFADGVACLATSGVTRFLELGPDGVLSSLAQQTLAGEQPEPPVFAVVLRAGRDETAAAWAAIGALWSVGVEVAWPRAFAGWGARTVELPTYAFQRQRYWPKPGMVPVHSGAGTAVDAVEARFWDAVEREDLESLAGALALSDTPAELVSALPLLSSWRKDRRDQSVIESWRYRVTWKPITELPAPGLSGTWLLVTPDQSIEVSNADLVAGTADVLGRAGVDVISVSVGAGDIDREKLAQRIRYALGDATLAGVMSLAGLIEQPIPGTVVPAGVALTVALVQAMTDEGMEAPLWTVTSGAVSVGPAEKLARPEQAQVWGLGRVVGLELPGLWGGLVDVVGGLGVVGDVLVGVLGSGVEDQVAVRGSGVFGRRLVRAGVGGGVGGWRGRGSVLVTGGTGGLGAVVARWLVGCGVGHVVLLSRRGLGAPGVVGLVGELEGLGGRVSVVAGDVCDRGFVEGVVAGIPVEFPLSGVVHAAGVGDVTPLGVAGLGDFAGVMGAKVGGARVLDEVLGDRVLDFFVVFSSVAGVWGSGGQSGYAAANAFLDGLVVDRVSRGLVGLSVSWGAWGGGGMAAGEASVFLRRRGLRVMDPGLAVAALGVALREGDVCVTVADVDWAGFVPVFTASRSRPLIEDIPEVRRILDGTVSEEATSDASPLARTLIGKPEPEQHRLMLDIVRRQVAAVLGHGGPEDIAPALAFKQLGFDSLTAVELRNRLATETGLRLPASLAFDYPTSSVLATHLRTEVLGLLSDRISPDTGGPAGSDEPIAIVAMSCRYPGGVRSPEQLWELVTAKLDAMTDLPTDRGWPAYQTGTAEAGSSWAGGFVDGAAEFDGDLFAISPREALAMDPQQRLLLEAAWEVLERAGVAPTSLNGSRTGVFIGTSGQDYAGILAGGSEDSEGHRGTGNSASVLSGRLAYVFGLEGPAITVDTACSSSLVALHLAVQALRAGECELALAGGVTVMATPTAFAEFSRQLGLAADGRCKSYAAAADGTGWGEGVGLLAVERLSDARRLGHEVLAVVAGSAVNQDGASNGLTAPNGPSQQRVIRQALANARLQPMDVDVVEGHGTGTRLGDPIEAQALLATYGQGRAEGEPLWLGSVKSNIGHTQAAAGVAGVIKMVMALRHGTMPATLHVDEPTTQVDWTMGAVELLTESQPWPVRDRPRRAAVSSFGMSGTNAHVIIEQAPNALSAPVPVVVDPAGAIPTMVPWILSGRSPAALRGQAERLREFASADDRVSVMDVGWSLAVSRSDLEHRAVVVGSGVDSLLASLETIASDGTAPAAIGEGRLGFLFTGQGSQRVGMGLGLYEAFPVFAVAFDAVCAELDVRLGRPLRDVLGDGVGLGQTAWTQAALFAVEVAVFRLVESWGVVPDYLLGHSVGEVAAAHVAGVLSLADACVLVAERGRLMQALPSGGAMAAVGVSEAVVLSEIGEFGVEVAAVNAPGSVVVSGAAGSVDAYVEVCRGLGRRVSRLDVSHAFHSVLMEPMLAEFEVVLRGLTFAEPQIPVVSNLTGAVAAPGEMSTADYWVRQVRQAVRFADGVVCLHGLGVGRFLELGPDGVLSAMAQQTLPTDAPAVFGVVLRAGRDEAETALAALGHLWTAGVDVDWAAVFADRGARTVALPTYAFQRERYWPRPRAVIGDVAGVGLVRSGHPLLGAAVSLAGGEGVLLTGRLSLTDQPWLGDHVVLGRVVVPGTALVEMVLRAGQEVGCGQVRELLLQAPLVLPDTGGIRVQVRVDGPDESGDRSVYIYSSAEGPDASWMLHASGALATDVPASGECDVSAWPPAGAEPVDVDGFYDLMSAAGYGYGPVFRGVRQVWRDGHRVCAEIALPESGIADVETFGIHPALLDAALHPAGFLTVGEGESGEGPRLPFAWTGVHLFATGATVLRVVIEQVGDAVRVQAADTTGQPVIVVDGLVLRAVSGEQLPSSPAAAGAADALYTVDWSALPAAVVTETGNETDLSGWATVATLAGSEHGIGAMFADLAHARAAIRDGSAAPAVVVLPLPHAATAGVLTGADAGTGVSAHVRRLTADVLEVVQGWLVDEAFAGSRLVVVTRGAVPVGPGGVVRDLAAAAVWGLLRSARTENPGRIVLADLDPADPTGADGWALLTGVVAAGAESELAVRGGSVWAARLIRGPGGLTVPQGADRWVLDVVGAGGSLEDLSLLDAGPVPVLGVGEVLVEVRAAGVNFRDVLIGLGMYPGGGVMGSEAAGIVLEVGPEVADLSAGDRVFGFLAGGFGSAVVTDRRLLATMPDGWSFVRAASVPLVFATAYYALRDLGGVSAGESVLVHAAAGGVGMAAVQLAKFWGLEVFGTASSPKWPVLVESGLSADHVASSRDLVFEEQFRSVSGGRGVDVVLNSLAGEFVDASLRLLAPGGRFLEMGKTDVRGDAGRDAVSYQAFDLSEAGPTRMGEILREVVALFDQGALVGLPLTVWDVRDAVSAWRHMAQARHVGKNVVTIPSRSVDPDGTVLITGGTGTLGGLLARHLVTEYGVRHLLLLSRQGSAAEGAEALVAELSGLGAQARVVACDAADRDALAAVLDGVEPGHPLTGVVHTAGVLDDGVFTALTRERVEHVLRAKVDGAVNLHALTAGTDLSLFVMYSSASATFGSPGQANYAAANAFLDGLASVRRGQGLAGLSLGWGMWEQASTMTGGLGQSDLSRVGQVSRPLTTAEGLALFDAALGSPRAQMVPIHLGLATLRSAGIEVPALLRGLVGDPGRRIVRETGQRGGPTLVDKLVLMPEVQRDSVLLDLVVSHAATVLGHNSPDAIASDRPFKDLGFDSLTAVELRNRLNTVTGARLPATLVFDHPTPRVLARHLRDTLLPPVQTSPERVVDELARLEGDIIEFTGSDRTAVRARLELMLERLRGGDPRLADTDDQDLADATAENIFALIDSELDG